MRWFMCKRVLCTVTDVHPCTLQVRYPDRVFLIRGNHESRGTTGYFGFKVRALWLVAVEVSHAPL
jgi:hypothetical protein